MKSFRARILATSLLTGASLLGSPAFAQDAQPVADQNQPTDPAAAPPAGPVEANPTPVTSAQGAPVSSGQDIVITGSRIPQPNLNSAAPITTVSTQDIKLQGTTRVEDLLNSLPSIGASMTAGQSNGASGVAEIDLRYLGPKRSLVLVNGRRMVPGDPNSTTQAADVNFIPASLIKRVEVLTGGASSVYGADAVAGVVNFIMDTTFTGVKLDGQYSFFQHNNDNIGVSGGLTIRDILAAKNFDIPRGSVTDGGAFDGSISLGASLDDGRGHAVAYFGYRKVKAVLQADRDYSACTIQNNGAGVPTCGGSANAVPGNAVIFAPTTDGAITSTLAALGPGTITPFGAPNIFNFAPFNYYQRPDERYVAGAFADYEISEAIKPYLEVMFMDDHTLAQIAPSLDGGNTLVINCDNPLMSAQQRATICATPNLINGDLAGFPTAIGARYNPNPGAPPKNFIDPTTGTTYNRAFFQLLRRNAEGGPRISDLKHTSYRGVVGARGDLSSAFSYDAYFQYGKTNYSQVFRNELSLQRVTRALDVITDPRADSPTSGQPICRSVLDGTDLTCQPWDVFGAAGPSQASLDYINVFGVIDGLTSEQIGNVNFTGELGDLGMKTPWASDGIGINVGAEYRREALVLNPDQSFQTADLTGQGGATLPVDGSFRVFEFFAETQIPIVQHDFIEDLTLSAGYRKSWYKTEPHAEFNGPDGQPAVSRKYDTDTYKLSLEFAPIRDIRFRGSYNRAVRAPNIQELFNPNFVALDGTADPCAGHAIGTMPDIDFGCIATGLALGRNTPSNPAGQYNGLLGGNPNLNPEKATTKTVGVILQPRMIPRFALTVDYWNIGVKDAIQGFGADNVINACVNQSTATFTSPACALVHRDPSGSLWLLPGGQLGAGFIEDFPTNVGKFKTDGIDVNASYSHRLGGLGNWSTSFLGTYVRHYKVNNGLTEPYDCAGLYGPTCSGNTVASQAPIPRWRHKLRTTLDTPMGLGLSLQWRRMGKVKAETLEDNESLGGVNNFEPGLRIPAQNYFDLAASMRIGDHLNVRAGVNNLFDKEPPMVTSGNGNRPGSNLCPTGPCNGNTYPGSWDALGRYIFMSATIEFTPRSSPPLEPVVAAPPPPPPPEAPPASQTCPDGSVVLATAACPAPPPPPPPPVERGERGS